MLNNMYPKAHPKVINKNIVKKQNRYIQISIFFVFFILKGCIKNLYEERRRKLVEAGIIPVLVQLCKTIK